MHSSFSRTSRPYRADLFPRVILPAFVLAVLVAQTPIAHAQVDATLKIHNEGDLPTNDVTVNLSNWITFDSSSGRFAVVTPEESDLSASGGKWEWATDQSVPVPGMEDVNGNPVFETRPAVLHWTNTSRTDLSVMNIAGDVDPILTYSLSIKNTTAVTQTYTLSFSSAIAPLITGDYSVYADVGVSLTNDNSTTADATIAPVSPATKFQVLTLSDGVTPFNAGVDVGGSYSRLAIGGTSTFGDASGFVNGTTGLSLNAWELTTSFTLTGGNDAVGISGFAQIIPEPSTYAALLGAGVLGVVALRRRKNVGTISAA
jgi:PEP-CTERM motif